MPEVSRFYGIVIKVFYDDHNPPHFHAEYGEHEVLVNIKTLAILSGGLPARALGMVAEWACHCVSKSYGPPGTGQANFSHPGGSRLCREIARSHNDAVHSSSDLTKSRIWTRTPSVTSIVVETSVPLRLSMPRSGPTSFTSPSSRLGPDRSVPFKAGAGTAT